ncbi:hypothetical protein B0J18DRAFT_132752 [Chaetomium sp. MPI-SDFR-AT-0129]|nr:hypothetical protein B0J18DRAFT_132752 [Chaetomium sp. MPI-SDFR-AT-0129]
MIQHYKLVQTKKACSRFWCTDSSPLQGDQPSIAIIYIVAVLFPITSKHRKSVKVPSEHMQSVGPASPARLGSWQAGLAEAGGVDDKMGRDASEVISVESSRPTSWYFSRGENSPSRTLKDQKTIIINDSGVPRRKERDRGDMEHLIPPMRTWMRRCATRINLNINMAPLKKSQTDRLMGVSWV